MLNIDPIRLLEGSHSETAQTGQGCFMNVISYLNGEPQITDESPCVCPVVRKLAIWLNDFALSKRFTPKQIKSHSDRLLPFIHRAMGSVTTDKTELVRRAWLAVDFANEMKAIAAYAADAADAADAANAANAAANAAAYAAYAANAAAYAAANAAADAADVAKTRLRIVEAGFKFLDAALPQADIPRAETIKRATDLVAIYRQNGSRATI